MTEGSPSLPGYWHFAWMIFMQPMTLHHRLMACGIDKPDISGWTYWRQRHSHNHAYGDYLARLCFLLSLPILGILLLLGLLSGVTGLQLLLGGTIEIGLWLGNWGFSATNGPALGMIFAGVMLCVMFGVVLRALLGVALGVMFGAVIVWVLGKFTCMMLFAVALGGVDYASIHTSSVGMDGVPLVLVLASAFGSMFALSGEASVGLVRTFTLFRLPIFPLEALIAGGLFLLRGRCPVSSLRYAPVLFHELSFLPYPFLARHIVEAAEMDPGLAARVLAACRITPGQRRVGERALAELQARELRSLGKKRQFQAALGLRGRWLPGSDTDSPLLRTLSEAARFLTAAQGSTSPYLARQHLESARQQLATIDNLLQTSREPLARFLPETIRTWRGMLADLQAENQRAAAELLPNPFITGNPLSGEQPAGKDLFRGREATIHQVEGLLAGDRASLALIGPRRCGKSSLINMFKVWLPDTQVVLFDLQDNPASTPEGFYHALAEQARRQAGQDRRLRLPPFPEGPPIEGLRDWLDALEQFPGVARFLICIDEFERLPGLFPSEGPALLQFMGLLRATIQHRRRVRLLVAGAAPFDELDALWSDHFINLREIRVGYLDEAACLGLLSRPVPEFPPDAIPEPVARALVARTGGQPYLVQLYGSLLVDELNEVKRKTAAPDDLEPVEERVLDQAGYYFHNLWNDLPPTARALLPALADGRSIQPDPATQRWLRRRLILSEESSFMVPVFGRWIRENELPD